jgi:hypothetical protein
MDLARVMRPFPTEVLAHLLSAHHGTSVVHRAAAAAESWNKTGQMQCEPEDMDVLYEKLGVAYPLLLEKVVVSSPMETRCLEPTYPADCVW